MAAGRLQQRNSLLRRVQRHRSMSVIFRAAEAEPLTPVVQTAVFPTVASPTPIAQPPAAEMPQPPLSTSVPAPTSGTEQFAPPAPTPTPPAATSVSSIPPLVQQTASSPQPQRATSERESSRLSAILRKHEEKRAAGQNVDTPPTIMDQIESPWLQELARKQGHVQAEKPKLKPHERPKPRMPRDKIQRRKPKVQYLSETAVSEQDEQKTPPPEPSPKEDAPQAKATASSEAPIQRTEQNTLPPAADSPVEETLPEEEKETAVPPSPPLTPQTEQTVAQPESAPIQRKSEETVNATDRQLDDVPSDATETIQRSKASAAVEANLPDVGETAVDTPPPTPQTVQTDAPPQPDAIQREKTETPTADAQSHQAPSNKIDAIQRSEAAVANLPNVEEKTAVSPPPSPTPQTTQTDSPPQVDAIQREVAETTTAVDLQPDIESPSITEAIQRRETAVSPPTAPTSPNPIQRTEHSSHAPATGESDISETIDPASDVLETAISEPQAAMQPDSAPPPSPTPTVYKIEPTDETATVQRQSEAAPDQIVDSADAMPLVQRQQAADFAVEEDGVENTAVEPASPPTQTAPQQQETAVSTQNEAIQRAEQAVEHVGSEIEASNTAPPPVPADGLEQSIAAAVASQREAPPLAEPHMDEHVVQRESAPTVKQPFAIDEGAGSAQSQLPTRPFAENVSLEEAIVPPQPASTLASHAPSTPPVVQRASLAPPPSAPPIGDAATPTLIGMENKGEAERVVQREETAVLPQQPNMPPVAPAPPSVSEQDDDESYQPVPLEEALNLQRKEKPDQPALFEPTTVTTPEQERIRRETADDVQIREHLARVSAEQITDSSVEVRMPRRPRPKLMRRERLAQPEAQQTDSPEPSQLSSVDPFGGVPETFVQEAIAPMSTETVARSAAEPTLISTEIGALPSDLWQLLGQPSPAPAAPEPQTAAAETAVLQRTQTDAAAAVLSRPSFTDVLPPIQRAESDLAVTPVASETAVVAPDGAEVETETEDAAAEPAVDMDELAQAVYQNLQRRLRYDRERNGR